MYHTFKSSHAAQSYLNCKTMKRSRVTLVRLHFGISDLRVGNAMNLNTLLTKTVLSEDEIYFLFQCPVSFSTRHKHTAEFMDKEGPATLKAFLEALVFRDKK